MSSGLVSYLTLVTDHRAGKVIRGAVGKSKKTADAFFSDLDPPGPPEPG